MWEEAGGYGETTRVKADDHHNRSHTGGSTVDHKDRTRVEAVIKNQIQSINLT